MCLEYGVIFTFSISVARRALNEQGSSITETIRSAVYVNYVNAGDVVCQRDR